MGAGDIGHRRPLCADTAGGIVHSPGALGALKAQPICPAVPSQDASEISGGGSPHEGFSTEIREISEE
jgi:hypothetical protein